MLVCDGTGQLVATVGGLTLRRATAEQVRAATQAERDDLYRVSWQPVPMAQSVGGAREGCGGWGGGAVSRCARCWTRCRCGRFACAVGCWGACSRTRDRRRDDVGRVVGWEGPGIELPLVLQIETARALSEVQALLSDAQLVPAALVWVTCSAISTGADDGVGDLVRAPLWGLLRSTRNEHSDRVLRLLDVERRCADRRAAVAAARCRRRAGAGVAQPTGIGGAASSNQRERKRADGSSCCSRMASGFACARQLEPLHIVDANEALEPLARGQVRVRVRAAGVNFRDVLNMLDVVPAPWLGLELAGEVIEISEGVD